MEQKDVKNIPLGNVQTNDVQPGEIFACQKSPDVDEESVAKASLVLDEAEAFLNEHAHEWGEYEPAEAKRILRKIDLRLLPLLIGTVTLAAIDKIAISNAALYGMSKQTHLVGQQYSWVGSIFYFGYLISQFPANYSLQRLPVGRAMAYACVAWGVTVTLLATTHNFAGLAVLRFIMGCCEAYLFPCCTMLLTMWYTNKEQPARTGITFSAFSSLIIGVVSYGIGHSHAKIATWRLLFITLGGATIIWGIVLWFFLPNSPLEENFLKGKDKYIALDRVKSNMTGVESHTFKWNQVKEAFMDYKTYCLFLFFLSMNVPTGGLVTFAAQIVSGLGFPALETTLLGMPTGVVQTFAGFSIAYSQRFMKNKRCLSAGLCCFIPLTCSILIRKLPHENKGGRLAAYYAFYFFWGSYATALSLPMANVSGYTKKLTVSGVVFVAYCTANIIGPQVFRTNEAPAYTTGYNSICGFEVLEITSLAIYAIGCMIENKRRDRLEGTDVDVTMTDLVGDMTDREKRGFRYVY